MQNPETRLRWSPESESDLLTIWHWGASHFSPEIADRHVRDIHRAALSLVVTPLIGRARNDLRAGVRELVIYPTVLFYRVRSDVVEVIRVVDGRRDLAALFDVE